MRLVCSSASAQYDAQCLCVKDNCCHYALCTMHTMQAQKCAESRDEQDSGLLSMVLSVCVEDNCSQHSNSHNLLTPTYPLCDTLWAPILVVTSLLITVILLHTQISKLTAWHWVFWDSMTNLQNILDVFWKKPASIEARYWLFLRLTFDKCVLLRGYMGSTLYVSH